MTNYTKRYGWAIAVLFILAYAIAWASDTLPFALFDSNGQGLYKFDTHAQIQCRGARIYNSTARWTVADTSGTTKTQVTPLGVICLLDSDDSFGVVALDGTVETTVTYGTAEADTNYRVMLTLDGTANVTEAIKVTRRNTANFVIGNRPQYPSTVSAVWWKVRTSE